MARRAPHRALATALVLTLALGSNGCVTLGRNRIGEVPPAAAVVAVPEGASLREVLERLGAPLESWMAPDGLLLIWRKWQYNYDRLEIDPSRPLSAVNIDPLLGSALENLKLVLERGTLTEDRVAVLFNREGRVVAVAHRDSEGKRVR